MPTGLPPRRPGNRGYIVGATLIFLCCLCIAMMTFAVVDKWGKAHNLRAAAAQVSR